MSIFSRRVAARPERTASEAWGVAAEVLFGSDADAREACERLSGIVAMTIAEQVPESHAITLIGTGPRIRLYFEYGDEAISGDDVDERPVDLDTEDRDWTLWLPCGTDDYEWMHSQTEKESAPIMAYDIEEGIPEKEESAQTESVKSDASDDWNVDPDRFRNL